MQPVKWGIVSTANIGTKKVIPAMLKAKGVEITGREDSDQGRFAWIIDPEGTKIELWEPK